MEQKNSTKNTKKPSKNAWASNLKINIIRTVILLIAFIMMLLGLNNNGFNDVMSKSIRICYECIGIG